MRPEGRLPQLLSPQGLKAPDRRAAGRGCQGPARSPLGGAAGGLLREKGQVLPQPLGHGLSESPALSAACPSSLSPVARGTKRRAPLLGGSQGVDILG